MKIIRLSYLNKLEPILVKLEKETGIGVEQGKDIIESYFHSLNSYIRDSRMPKIIVPVIGTFKVSTKRIGFILRRAITSYKKGISSREKVIDKISWLWGIKQRIYQERRGDLTYWKWNNRKNKKKYNKLLENYERHDGI